MARGRSEIWVAMSIPAYRVLFYSAAIVVFGVMGQAVARGWLAHELTDSNTGLGGVMLAFGAAMLVTTPMGGVAADRYPKRLVLVLAVAALTISSVAVGIAVVTDTIEYWMLVVASAMQAAAFAFYLPTRISLIAEIVPAAMLQNAVVLAQMSQEGMRVVAPALAGVLIGVAWFGVGGVFLASGVLSALAATLVLALPQAPRRAGERPSPLSEIVDAIRYMRSNAAVGQIAALTVGVVMVGYPYLAFLPTLAQDRFDVGAVGFGVMSGVAGVGALVAGVVDASRSRGQQPWRTIAGSGAAFGLALIALGLAGSFPVALLAVAAVGASGLMFQTSTQSLMLRISPLEYHGRLQSMVILGFSGFGLMALPLGLLADAITLRRTLMLMGCVILAMTGVFAAVRKLHRRQPTTAEIG